MREIMTKGQTEQLKGHGLVFLTPAFSRRRNYITVLGLCKTLDML